MGTIVEFRLLVLYSLKYSSKAESPTNRSTTSQQNHLFIYLFILFLFFIFYFYFFSIYLQKADITVLSA